MNETCLLSVGLGGGGVHVTHYTMCKVNKEKSRVTFNDAKGDYAKCLTIAKGEIKECLTAKRSVYLLRYSLV